MANKTKKLMAMLMTAVMLIMLFPAGILAADEHTDEVHVIVENTTYAKAAGAPWEGRIIDTWVKLNAGSTGLSVLKEAIGESNVTVQDSGYGAYITAIKGIQAGDGGSSESGYNMAGWMYFLNDTATSFGISGCTVADGTLSAGDEIAFCYSLTGGSDIGYDWSDTTKKALKSLTVSEGILSPAFASDVTAYTLTVPADVTEVVLSPEAENKSETVTITADGNAYKRAVSIPITNGTRIAITSSNGSEETVYSIYVKQEQQVSADTMREGVLNVLDSGLTGDACGYGNEWAVLALARNDSLSDAKKEAYYASVEKAVEEAGSAMLDTTYATTNARVVLALAAIGKNPQEVAGYNLLQPLANMDYVTGQGINAAVYALLAFDAGNYAIPAAGAGETQTTREGLIQKLLDAQLADGGWDYSGISADPDMTAMVLQAFAPYYSTNASVKAAVDKGLQVLSNIQNPDGTYSSWGYTSSYSAAQVLTALSVLKINPLTDSRFIKNGRTLVDVMGDFYIAGAGFKGNIDDATAAAGANVQAAYALVAYDRYVKNKTSLYNMTDVTVEEPETTAATTTEATTASGEATSASTAQVNTPKTGDNTPAAVVTGVMLLSMLGIAATNWKKAKR